MSTTRTTYQNIRTGIAICRLNSSAGQKSRGCKRSDLFVSLSSSSFHPLLPSLQPLTLSSSPLPARRICPLFGAISPNQIAFMHRTLMRDKSFLLFQDDIIVRSKWHLSIYSGRYHRPLHLLFPFLCSLSRHLMPVLSPPSSHIRHFRHVSANLGGSEMPPFHLPFPRHAMPV